jgi:hypothetical protein
MPITRLTGSLALLACPILVQSGAAAVQEDPFVALVTNAQGSYTYVRRENIEALTDVSPSHCLLSLATSSKTMRAFQKCSSVLEKLQRHDFVTIPADFGNTYVAPEEIATMAWTGNSRCQIALKSGKFVYAKQSCNEVHDGLLHE